MGMEKTVLFVNQPAPPWTAVQNLLASRGFETQIRMIDGELAFPDEMPPELWRELRVGTPHGMITLRREPDRMVVVTWGNAEGAMRQAWLALTWAVAEAGGGRIQSPDGMQTAAEFLAGADLSDVLKDAPDRA
jgi:hypothetical protein